MRLSKILTALLFLALGVLLASFAVKSITAKGGFWAVATPAILAVAAFVVGIRYLFGPRKPD